MESKQQGYNLLSLGQAVIGGTIFVIAAFQYGFNAENISNLSLTGTVAILGLIVALYYGSIHQVIKRRFSVQSALTITALSSLNILVLVAATGGLNSPYLSFWLLVVVASGAFGWIFSLITISGTLFYYGYEIVRAASPLQFAMAHLPQVGLTVAAGILAEMVYYRGRRVASQTHQKVASLSGELNQEQGKAQAIVSSMADAVIVVDTAGKISLFNPAAETMTGWDAASALGLDYKAVLSLRGSADEALTPATDPLQLAQSQGKSVATSSVVLLTRAGRKIALSISVSPIQDGSGKVTGSVAVFRDISQEREVARQRDEFISTASHEMRTPVAAIEGYLALALNAKVANVDERAKGYLDKAHASTQHLARLFQDLLSATKVEDGNFPKKTTVVNLTELLQSVTEDLQFSTERHGLALNFKVASVAAHGAKSISPLYLVLADPERLREVVMNLAENAFKFTKEGSVTISITGNNEFITVSVMDTGIGIAREDMKHLFQKFYRIDNTETREIGGTGLGLYLCRAIIEAYNGRIWVESELGQGSTFSFSLPRLKPNEAAAIDAAEPVVATPQAKPEQAAEALHALSQA